ncbi:MAG: alkaline phosphatase [Anaerohalosphaeraceae bacterium]
MKINLIQLASVIWLSCAFVYAEPPKNVLFYIGDGMGFEQVEAAEIYSGSVMSFNTPALFPYRANCTTCSANSSVTDSAAGGTALATGVKVNNGVISMANPGNGAELRTLLEYFKAQGKAVGLITTAYLTHATPAAFGSHDLSRNSESTIAVDYLTQTRPNILFGGGSHGLTLDTTAAAGYTVTNGTTGFQVFATDDNPLTAEFFSAQFGTGYLPYKEDYLGGTYPYPKLDDMVTKAIQILSEDPDGFFLMVEGGRIDHACHSNLIKECVHEVIDLSNAVQAGYNWASSRCDTLLLITADHETGGLAVDGTVGDDGYPTATWTTTGHTGQNIPVYAWGVNAAMFTGTLNNTDMFDICTADMTSVNIEWLWTAGQNGGTLPDFNADGKMDIIWRNVNTGAYIGTITNAIAIAQTRGLGGSSTTLQIAGLADFNADGKTDLLWRNVNTGVYMATQMDGLTMVQTKGLGGSRTTLQIAGLADFNADNKTDILWRHVNTGAYMATQMDGLTMVQTKGLGGSSTTLQIADMADFNADGKTDILWRNVNTGAYLWTLMDGLNALQTKGLGGSRTTLQIVTP